MITNQFVFVVLPILSADQFAFSAADIDCSPVSWDYGSVAMTGYLENLFMVTNLGLPDRSITSTTLTRSDASDFSIQSEGGAFNLVPLGIHSITALFLPANYGSKRRKPPHREW